MDETKPILASATVWAGVGTLLGTVLHALGYNVSDADISTLINYASMIVTLGGGIATIFFRIKATKTLTVKPQGAKP